jgi:uncharacterized protein (DUF488 family)
MIIYTIGYGNRAIGDFIDLLRRYGVQVLVDTRSVPYSRFRPAFRKNTLQQHLLEAGITYHYMGDELGGKLVDPRCIVDGVVDLECLMAKDSFRAALSQVEQAAREGEIQALMCAELRPENCHRAWMLAPLLLRTGLEVLHISETGDLKTQAEVLPARLL